MDSPVRKMQKKNDYNRHKLFRKIRRRRRAAVAQQLKAAEKELKRKLRVTPIKYGDGKVNNAHDYTGPFRPLSYAQEFSDMLKESIQKAPNHLKQNQAINTAKKLSKRHVSTVLYIGGNAEQVREKFWKQEPVLDHAVDSIANEYGINPEILKYRINKEGFVDSAVRLNNTAAGSEYKYSDPGGYSLLHSPIFGGPGDFGLDDYVYYIKNGAHPINENWGTVHFVNEKKRSTAAATGITVADNIGMVASLLHHFVQLAKHDYPSLSDYDLNRYALAYYNRGQAGGRKWAENGAKGYEFRPKGFMLMPQYAYKNGKTTSGIHIKPSHRGRLTALKKRTGKSEAELYRTGSAATRKMITFARNARKWNK